MVRAILEGRKTQTRRKLSPKTEDWLPTLSSLDAVKNPNSGLCPYGYPGDRLWVRETWRPKGHNFPIGNAYEYRATAEQDLTPTDGPWKPSIFMPRAASRITLEVVSVRVERLQDLYEDDAIAEGIEPIYTDHGKYFGNYGKEEIGHLLHPFESYRTLWTSINGPDSWESNPWVWVVEFKLVTP